MNEMKWSMYLGTKAEGDRDRMATGPAAAGVPSEWVLERFGANLFAIWPTKLTLAPEASKALTFALLDTIAPELGRPTRATQLPCGRPQYGVEDWKRSPGMPWAEFRSAYSLDEFGAG